MKRFRVHPESKGRRGGDPAAVYGVWSRWGWALPLDMLTRQPSVVYAPPASRPLLSGRGLGVVWWCLVCVVACGDEDGAPTSSAPGTVYVDATASTGGDGSQGAPYRTLAEALAHPETVDTVQIAEGTYLLPEAHQVTTDLELVGAGVDRVFWNGSGRWSVDASLSVSGVTLFSGWEISGSGAVALRSATVTGPEARLAFLGLASVELQATTLDSAGGLALEQVAEVTLTEVLLRDVADGLAATSVGTLDATGLTLERVVGHGLVLVETAATLRNLSVADIQPNPSDDDTGDGLHVRGGTLTIEGGTLERCHDRGLFLSGVMATLTDVMVSQVQRRTLLALQAGSVVTATGLDAGFGPSALLVTDGSELTLTHGFVHDTTSGCLLSSDGAQLDVSETIFRDCQGGHISLLGPETGGRFTRNRLENALESCVLISGSRVPVVLEGNTITNCVASGVSTLGVRDLQLIGNTIDTVARDPVFMDVGDGVAAVDSAIVARMNTLMNTEAKGFGLLRSSGDIENNWVTQAGDSGVSLVEPPQDPDLQVRSRIVDNTLVETTVAGVAVFTTTADVEGNQIADTRFDPSVGLGDGVVFALGADVNVRGNTVENNTGNGISFDSSTGVVEGNVVRGNLQYGVVDFCTEVDSGVTVGENTYADNNLGDVRLCDG